MAVSQVAPGRKIAFREAIGRAVDAIACPPGGGGVPSRQYLSGDRGMPLDGSGSGHPLNEKLDGHGPGSRASHDGTERRRALVADEDPMMLWLLRRALADDFDVTTAENGQRAVDLAATCGPDVIVLDLDMPVMDGFAACRLIRTAHPRIPIVIVSGNTDEDSVRSAFEVGATDYLTKPFTPSQLRARLQACLLRAR
jgi:CheY-like chemotaxis protein